MFYEVIETKIQQDFINSLCVVSLQSKSGHSDMIFSDVWNLPLIRPIFEEQNFDIIGKSLKSGDKGFKDYSIKTKALLSSRKTNNNDVVLIDFRISDKIKSDVVLNGNGLIAEKLIEPVLINIIAANHSLVKDQGDDLDLIKDISDINRGIHAYQIIIAERLFDVKDLKSKGMIIFEESVIFSNLVLMGKI